MKEEVDGWREEEEEASDDEGDALDATFFFLADSSIPDEAEEEADKDEDACLPPGVSAFGF